MAQICLSMATGQLMHQGTTTVLESRDKNSAFKSSVLASWGQAGVWPEKPSAEGLGMRDLVHGCVWTSPLLTL